jgi:hypothetical protein
MASSSRCPLPIAKRIGGALGILCQALNRKACKLAGDLLPGGSANRAGLACRRGRRFAGLDHGGFQAVGDARGGTDANDQARADDCHCHYLEVGHAVSGKYREIVHTRSPKCSVIGRCDPKEGSWASGKRWAAAGSSGFATVHRQQRPS